MIIVRSNTKQGYEVAELGDSINLEYPNSKTRRGRVGKQIAQTITTSPQHGVVVLMPTTIGKEVMEMNDSYIRKIARKRLYEPVNDEFIRETISYGMKIKPKKIDVGMCLTARYYKGFSNYNPENAVVENLAVRKLTPKECFRLMGFDDADVDLLAENGISNTQLYKMAGNSIVVNMLEFVFCEIFDDNNEIYV
jgi:DNA (cytosine-5)-methyltransferase 1